MPSFSPEFSKIFKIASFVNLHSSILLVIFRAGIVLIFFLLTIVNFFNSGILATVWASLFALSVMMEFFYHFKILASKPSLKIPETNESSNIADSFTLSAARAFIKAGDWSTVAAIMVPIRKNIKIRSFFQKAAFSKDEVDALIKATSSEPVDL